MITQGLEPPGVAAVVIDRRDPLAPELVCDVFCADAAQFFDVAAEASAEGDDFPILILVGHMGELPERVLFVRDHGLGDALASAFDMARALGEQSRWGLRLADDALLAEAMQLLRLLDDGAAAGRLH